MTRKIRSGPAAFQALAIASAGILSLAFITSAHAEENRLRTYITNDSGWVLDETVTSIDTSVSYDSSPSSPFPVPANGFGNTGDAAGFADFGVLRGQAYASASGDNSSTNSSMSVQTRFTAFVNAAAPPVGSGPGLNFGDSVSINLSFRLDGILNSAAASGNNTGSANVVADLEILDPNILLDCGSPDGCYTPKLLDLRATADSTSYGGTGDTINSWSWNLSTRNALDQLIESLSDSDYQTIGPGTTCSGPGSCTALHFDTGTLSTTIETTIGAELDIFARLNILSQGWNFQGDGGYGSADFFDTYGLLLTPVTEGVELGYNIIPATTVVPVPAAAWLFVSALAGLIGIAVRKTA